VAHQVEELEEELDLRVEVMVHLADPHQLIPDKVDQSVVEGWAEGYQVEESEEELDLRVVVMVHQVALDAEHVHGEHLNLHKLSLKPNFKHSRKLNRKLNLKLNRKLNLKHSRKLNLSKVKVLMVSGRLRAREAGKSNSPKFQE